ncbi:hypothetical protein CP8484711_1805A, partial [Chlamydia psittaci 84-8471/1]
MFVHVHHDLRLYPRPDDDLQHR